jgi:hypothetical protein
MLSNFLDGIGALTRQDILFLGFVALIFAGALIVVRNMTKHRSEYFILVMIWVTLAILVGVTRNQGGLIVLFQNPIIIAILGALAGLGHRLYLKLTSL